MDWGAIWDDIVNFFKNNAWNIVIFFAVLLIGIILVKIIINVTRRLLNKTSMEKITIGFICAIIKICLYVLLVLILLSIIGIEITGLLTAISALVLAIGMALENIIANAANGIVIVSNKMFKKGDYIEVDGKEGNVIQINFLFTTILTADNKRVTIPNSTIVNSSVVDYDTAKTRRVEWKFTVAYESDVEKVKALILECIKSNGKTLLNPEPFCRLSALGSSSIEFTSRCWCDSEDYWDVYYDVLELVYNELKKNNISIPYDQVEIRERKDKVVLPYDKKSIPKRVEKERVYKESIDLENFDLTKALKKRHLKSKQRKDNLKKVIESKQNQIDNAYKENKLTIKNVDKFTKAKISKSQKKGLQHLKMKT